MHETTHKSIWSTLLGVIGLVALNCVVASDVPRDFQVADGVAVYIGLMPARIVRGHSGEQEERQMHGGLPTGRGATHLVVALFDDATGRRIEDAQVRASVIGPGSEPEWTPLETMRIADTVTYGGYFNMPATRAYRIELQIRLPGRKLPIEASFAHQHVIP